MINKLKNNKLFHTILSEEIQRFSRINESMNDAKMITPDIVWDAISEEISKELLASIDESATKYSATQLSEIPENIQNQLVNKISFKRSNLSRPNVENYVKENISRLLLENISKFGDVKLYGPQDCKTIASFIKSDSPNEYYITRIIWLLIVNKIISGPNDSELYNENTQPAYADKVSPSYTGLKGDRPDYRGKYQGD
jgi:hypothetical protein